MKSIFRRLTCGLLLLSAAFAGSCSSDPEEISSDLHLDRALMPLNFKAAVQTTGNEVKLTWDVRSTVAYYEVILYSDQAMTQAVKTVNDIAPADVPLTLTLDAEKSYYATVQAFGTDKGADPSKKASVGPFKTYAIMSALNPEITDRKPTSLLLKWDTDTYVSHIKVQPVTAGDPVDYTLTAAEIQAGAAEVKNLAPSTEYTLSVFYNSASRGSDTAWTRPDTEGATAVATAEALLKAVSDGAPKILVKYGETPYDVTVPAEPAGSTNAFSTISSSLSVVGETTNDGKKPVVKGLEVKLLAAAARAAGYSLHLEDLTLDGNGAGNVVNITAALAMDEISIKNCEIYNYAKGIFAENIAGTTVGNVTFEGLYVHDIEGSGGDVLDMRLGTYTNFTLKNSTFYNGGRSFLFLDAKSTVSGQVVIRNNTISSFALQTNRKGLICVRSLSLTQDKFTVEKNLILNENVSTGYSFISDYKECVIPQFAANYFFNCAGDDVFFVTKNTTPVLTADLALGNGGKKLTADPCEKSAKGKFYLTNGDVATVGVGDPRWWTAVPPVVPEQTELIALKDKYNWDFANTDAFEPQDVTRTRIFDNLQFFVADEAMPMKIAESGQIVFTQASKVGSSGVPTDNALAFKVDGPGSVIITPADAGYTKNMEIIVNGIRKSVPANGQESVFGFGDLQGETMVYICTGSPVRLNKLGWTTEVVSGGDAKQLETPVVTVTPTSIDAGAETVVDATWPAITGAVSYDVTFNGKTTNVTSPAYAVTAAVAKALKAGVYAVSVVAKPQDGSKSYTPSEPGMADLKVKAVLTAISTAYTWDIADATKFPAGNITETTVLDNLQFLADASKTLTIEHTVGADNVKTDRLKFNGGSTMSGVTPTLRGFAFRVSGNGTLTYKVVSGSSSGTGRMFRVSANGTQLLDFEAPTDAATATAQTLDITTLSGETTIYLYCTAALNIYELAWKPGGGTPQPQEYTTTLTRDNMLAAEPTLPTGSSGVTGPVTWSYDGVNYESAMAAGASGGQGVLYFYGSSKTAAGVNYLKTTASMGEIKSIVVTFLTGAWKAATKFSVTETVGGTSAALTPVSDDVALTHTFTFSSGNNGMFAFTGGTDDLKITSMVITYKK